MLPEPPPPRAVLLDLDGCVVSGIGRGLLPGALEAVHRLRERYPVRFVTNTTSRTAGWLRDSLQGVGLEMGPGDVVTPTLLARTVLEERGEAVGLLLAEESSLPDLAWFRRVPAEEARSVLVATEGHDRRIGELRDAVVALRSGARLYTLQENRIYHRDGRILTDLGPLTAFLGYAANVRWENFGKPSPLLFATLASTLGCGIDELVMVGDDAEFDVSGALKAGVGRAVLVRTGKYREGDETAFDPPPSLVLDSIASLPEALA